MKVLILVLMEDTLGVVVVFLLYRQAEKVLILVLMEDTLGENDIVYDKFGHP